MQTHERASELENDAELQQWMDGRKAVQHLYVNCASHGASLDAMTRFVPEVFHRQHEMKKTDTRHLRAVLDYIMYLQNPTDTAGAIQRRKSKQPFYRNHVITALCDTIPAHSFMEHDWKKEEVLHNDVGPVVLAARSFILELTEGRSGRGLTGAKAFDGVNFDKNDPWQSREGPSQSVDDSMSFSTQSTTLDVEPIALSQPLSAISTGTTASDLLHSYTKPVDTMTSPIRRISLPVRQTRSQRRSSSIKRSASDSREQASKRAKVDEIIDGEGTSKARKEREEADGVTTVARSHNLVKINFSITDPVLQVQEIVQNLQDEVLELRSKLAARDLEIEDLKANMVNLKDYAAKQTKDFVEMACLREAKKSLIEENARVRDENAVLKALAKSKGVTEDELKEQLANFAGF